MINLTLTTKQTHSKEQAKKWIGSMSIMQNEKAFTGTVKELAEKINDGHTIIPAILQENEVNKDGVFTKSRINFKSLQVIALDIENKENIQFTIEKAKELMIEKGLEYNIIYSTFSNAEGNPRFRIIFNLDKPVTCFYEAKAYMQSLANHFVTKDGIILYDDKCIDPLRLFYNGIVTDINEDAITKIDTMDIGNIIIKDTAKKTKVIQDKINDSIKTKRPLVIQREAKANLSMLDLISYINERVTEETEVDFENRYGYLVKLCKMSEVLDVYYNSKFACILPDHVETDGSAYIYMDDEYEGKGGTYHETYHCWGCDKRLDIVQLFKELCNLDDFTFFAIIEANTKLSIGSVYQKKGRKRIMDTQTYIRKQLKIDSPKVYNYFKLRNLFGVLSELLQFGADHLSIKSLMEDKEELCFFLSTTKLAELMKEMQGRNITQQRASEKLNTLAILGVIRKIELKELRPDVREKAIEVMNKRCEYLYIKRHINFYVINYLTPELLKRIENMIDKNREIGAKAKNESNEQVARTQGQEFADAVFVQTKKKFKMEDDFFNILSRKAEQLMKSQGFFNESILIKEIDKKGNKYKKADKIKKVAIYLPQYIATVIDEGAYKILRTKCNKNVRAKLNVPVSISSFSYIYIQTI